MGYNLRYAVLVIQITQWATFGLTVAATFNVNWISYGDTQEGLWSVNVNEPGKAKVARPVGKYCLTLKTDRIDV